MFTLRSSDGGEDRVDARSIAPHLVFAVLFSGVHIIVSIQVLAESMLDREELEYVQGQTGALRSMFGRVEECAKASLALNGLLAGSFVRSHHLRIAYDE